MSADVAAVLATRLVGPPPAFASRLFDRLREHGGLTERGLRDGLASIGASDAEVSELMLRLDLARQRLAELSGLGMRLLVRGGEGYPPAWDARLGRRAPRTCFAMGEEAVLGRPMVGIVGSRTLDDRAVHAARSFAEASVAQGRAVASGGARGADRVAMEAALEKGGTSVGVLASGLAKPASHPETVACLEVGRLALLSPYAPDASFTVGQAMGRNRLVYGLARCTLVVACQDGRGGTWAGALDALKLGLGPVFVWTGAGSPPENRALLRHGALPCEDPRRLAAWLERHPEPFPEVDDPPSDQLGLPF